jgi:hypothetical protein
VASNNYIYKMSNAGGMATVTRYTDMLAGNTTWNPWSPDGAFDALSTVTVPAGGVASITFAGIPNTYKHLQIRALGRDTIESAGDLRWQYNGDTATNYSFHELYGHGSTASSFGYGGTGYGNLSNWASFLSQTNQFSVAVLDILDYADTTKFKTGRAIGGRDNNGSGTIELASMSWRNTAAISSIYFYLTAGNFAQYSQFTLYGVK